MRRWRVPSPPYGATRFTHHVWYDTSTDQRIGLAVCGFIMARADSVVDPTCPVCRKLLAAHDRVPPEDR